MVQANLPDLAPALSCLFGTESEVPDAKSDTMPAKDEEVAKRGSCAHLHLEQSSLIEANLAVPSQVSLLHDLGSWAFPDPAN